MLAFSCYPLTAALNHALVDQGPIGDTMTLSNLRQLPLRRLWGVLRETAPDVLGVVVGEPTERALLPIMLMLAGLTRAKRIELVDVSAGTTRSVTRARALFGIWRSIVATVAGRLAKRRAARHIDNLLRAEPINFKDHVQFERCLYLKSNLMLGTVAGGSVGHIAGVANELFRRSKSFVLCALEFPAMVNPAVSYIPVRPLKDYGIPTESNHLRFDANCYKAGSSVLARGDANYVYQRLSIANFTGVRLSRKYNVPLILEYNGSEVWIAENWGLKLAWATLAKRIEQVCLRHAHRVITVSEVLADELRGQGVPDGKIITYPNCIEPEVFNPELHRAGRIAVRAEYGIGDNELVCTFLGTFGAWHGAEVLAAAIKRYVVSAHPEAQRLRFLMVGDGLLAAQCREMLQSEIARGDVIFTGIVAQGRAVEYLAASDVFLSPHVQPSDGSRFFGSPTKLFEYMAMAKPIIASSLDQIADVLQPAPSVQTASQIERWESSDLAILARPGSIEDIVTALTLLRDHPDWREPMGAAARRKALACYTWQQHVDQLSATL